MNDDIIFVVVAIDQYLNKLLIKFSISLDEIPTTFKQLGTKLSLLLSLILEISFH